MYRTYLIQYCTVVDERRAVGQPSLTCVCSFFRCLFHCCLTGCLSLLTVVSLCVRVEI